LSRDRTIGGYDAGDPRIGEASLLDRTISVPISARRWMATLLTLVAAASLRLPGLDRWPLTFAEADLALAAHHLVRGEAGAMHAFGAPSVVNWTALFFFAGWSADSVGRIAFALAGFAAVVLVLMLGRVLGITAAISAAALLAASPTMIAASRRIDGGMLYVVLTLTIIASVSLGQRREGIIWPALAGVATGLLITSGSLGIPAAALAWFAISLVLRPVQRPNREAIIATTVAAAGAIILSATFLLTRPGSLTATLGENLDQLWTLHLSNIGQHSYMPAFNLILNEPILIALACIGIFSGRQRDLVGGIGIWFVVTYIVMALLGGMAVAGYALVVLPLATLAGIGVAHLIERTAWPEFQRGPAVVYVVAVLLMVAAAVSLIGLIMGGPAPVSLIELITGGRHEEALTWILRFVLIVIAGVLPLSLALTWIGSRVDGNRLVLVLVAGLVLLSVVTIRSAVLAASERPGMPGDPLANGATGVEIPIVIDRLHRVSRDLTMGQRSSTDPAGGHGLRIGIDEQVRQPFTWYFRDYPNLTVFDPDTESLSNDVELAILDGSRDPNLVAPGYTGQPYVLAPGVPPIYESPEWGEMIAGVFSPDGWRRFASFLLNRDPHQPAPNDLFYLVATGEVAERLFTTIGPFALTDRPGAGSAAGQLNRPRGIVVGPDGNIFVVDSRNARVNVYGPAGEYLHSFGSEGSSLGQFGRLSAAGGGGASGIAIDDAGNIYVADTWNHRIQVFASDGTFLRAWGQFFDARDDAALSATQPGLFYGPRGVAFHDGLLFVTDTGNERVQVFQPDGRLVRMFGTPGSGEGELLEPVGIAVSGDGTIYVADSHNARIARFTVDGEWLEPWSVDVWAGLQFFEPYIAVAPDRTVYATTSPVGYVVTLGEDGLPGTPLTSAEMRQPFGIAVSEDGAELLVTDSGVHTVVRIPLATP
jgi:DNA-binding beta-propeller fold protein YncE